jgi:septal ring factor EnvC (AmiA/AmiB activator)
VQADRLAVPAALLAIVVAIAPMARAGAGDDPEDAHATAPAGERIAPRAVAAGDDGSPRAGLSRQLTDETAAIDRALAAVSDKLAGADQARNHRLAAALRVARAAPTDEAIAVARRRAAARLLLDRDRGERALLVDEVVRLRGARARVGGEVARLPVVALPGELARPAPGKIARHFGTLEHERSHATLSRRGIDIEVADHCPVVAPAAGTVRYAGPIRGLDRGAILDHGDYVTVIAKLGDVALPVGAQVAAGDVLGRAARRRVYLEVRVKLEPGGLPIDPEPLLAASASAPPSRAASRPMPHALD